MMNRASKWYLLDLGLKDYQTIRDLQIDLVNRRREERLTRDVVIFTEHSPVFTLGKRGIRDSLKVTDSFLKSEGIKVVHAERGGDITYHGPGQLVVYPIVNLKEAKWKVVNFVEALEEVMIRTLADFDIQAERNSLNHGVWVEKSKIGSIGIAIRRSISFHGLALNVNTDLEPFSWIDACGLSGLSMVSMKKILGRDITMNDVQKSIGLHIQSIFNCVLVPVSLDDIECLTMQAGE